MKKPKNKQSPEQFTQEETFDDWSATFPAAVYSGLAAPSSQTFFKAPPAQVPQKQPPPAQTHPAETFDEWSATFPGSVYSSLAAPAPQPTSLFRAPVQQDQESVQEIPQTRGGDGQEEGQLLERTGSADQICAVHPI